MSRTFIISGRLIVKKGSSSKFSEIFYFQIIKNNAPLLIEMLSYELFGRSIELRVGSTSVPTKILENF